MPQDPKSDFGRSPLIEEAPDPNVKFWQLFGGTTDAEARTAAGLFPRAPVTPAVRGMVEDEAQPKLNLPPSSGGVYDPNGNLTAPPERRPGGTPVADTLGQQMGEKYGAVGRDLFAPVMTYMTHLYSGVEPKNIFAAAPERIIAANTVTERLGPRPQTTDAVGRAWDAAVEAELKSPENALKVMDYRRQMEEEQKSDPLVHLISSVGSFGQFMLNTMAIGKAMPGVPAPIRNPLAMGTEEAVVPEVKGNAPEGSTMGSRFKEGVKTGAIYEATGGVSRFATKGIADPMVRAIAEQVPQNAVLGGALAPEGERIQGAVEGGLIGGVMGAAGAGPTARPPEIAKPDRGPAETRSTPAPAEPIVSKEPAAPPRSPLPEESPAEPGAHAMARPKDTPTPSREPAAQQSEVIERRTLITKLQKIRDHIASGGKASPIVSGKGSPARGRIRGLFRVKPEDVSLQRAQDVETLVHETSHHVSKYLWKSSAERDKALAPYRTELEPLATPGHPLEEGLAEYVRTLVENPQAAHNAAPSFSQNFLPMLEAKDPVLASHIAELQDSYQAWRKQGEWGRAKSVIVEPEKPSLLRPFFEDTGNIITYWDKFLYFTSRPRAPVEAVVRRYAREKGIRPEQIPADLNPALELKQAMATGGREGYFLREGVLDFNSQKVKPGTRGFMEILKDIKPSEKRDFEAWWTLKRAEALLRDGNPTQRDAALTLVRDQMRIDPKNLSELLNQTQKKYPHFQKAVDDMKALTDGAIDYLVAGGGLELEAAQKMKSVDAYAPWQRFFEEGETTTSGAPGRSMMSGQGVLKRLRGKTERPIVSPLAATRMMFSRITQAAENASIRRHFFKMLSQIDGHGSIASKLKTPLKPTTAQLKEIKSDLEAAGVDTSLIDLDEAFTVFRPDESFRSDRDKQIVSFINEKGVRESWKIHDKQLYDSIAGYDREIGGLTYKILKNTFGLFTSAKRFAIIAAPGLAIGANPLRDLPGRWINTGRVPWKESFKGLLGTVGLTEDARRMFNEAEWDGALLGTLTSQTMQKAHESVKTAMAGPFSPRRIAARMFEVTRRYMMITEAAPRIEEYELALKNPLPQDVTGRAKKIRAVEAARESSIDFAEVGRLARPFTPFTAFMGASIQGTYKFGEQIVKHPARLAAIGAGMTATAVATWLNNHDEEWKSEVSDRISPEEKATYLVWIGGDKKGFDAARARGAAAEAAYVRDHSFKVPKPWELGFVFMTLPENLMDTWKGKVSAEEARSRIASAAKQLAPPVVPDLLQMFYEQSTRWDTFRDRPLIPKSQEDVDPDFQYGPQTSETAKKIAWATNDAIRAVGGEKNDPGWISPYQVDHFLNLGPLAAAGIDFSDDLIRYLEGKSAPPEKASEGMRDVPFVGDIARRFTVNYPGMNSTPISEFYEVRDRLSKISATYNSMKKRPNITQEELRAFVKENRFEIGMARASDVVGKSLSGLRSKMNADLSRRDLTPERKRELRDEAVLKSISITQNWMIAYRKAEQEHG